MAVITLPGDTPVVRLTRNEKYRELLPKELIKLQKKSYQWFLEEGLPKIFKETFPIEVPTGKDGKFILEYVDYRFGDLSVENPFEAKKKQLTYSRPLYLTLRLRIKLSANEPEIIKENEVLLCDLPMMTDRGTFIFNGTERVYVNQLIKSPGIYRSKEDLGSKLTYRTSLSAIRGTPIDLETDVRKPVTAVEENILDLLPTSMLRFRIERTRSKRKKISATLLLRGMGFTYRDILKNLIFEYLKETEKKYFGNDFEYDESDVDLAETYLLSGNVEKFILESQAIQKVIDHRVNLKALFQILANTIRRDIEVEKILVTTAVDREQRERQEQEKALRVLYSKLVDEATRFVPVDVMYQQVFIFFDPERYDISLAGRYKLMKAFDKKVKCPKCGYEEYPRRLKCPKCGAYFKFDTVLTPNDFIDVVKYHMAFLEGFGQEDDLDHLSNRKLRRVGEQLYNQFKAGMIRLSRVVRERFMIAFGNQERVSDKASKLIDKFNRILASWEEPDEETLNELNDHLKILEDLIDSLTSLRDSLTRLARTKEIKKAASELKNETAKIIDKAKKLRDAFNEMKSTLSAGKKVKADKVKSVRDLVLNIMDMLISLKGDIDRNATIASAIEINISEVFTNRPVVGAIKQFFAQQSQLSQFLDQTNPLAELTHKRRISSLGPGGLHKERAGYEVRDVKSTHYGRICPIETPEGSNIGLITSLAILADSNDFDFLVTPYYKVENAKVNFDKVDYLDADDESRYVIVPADTELDEEGRIKDEYVVARKGGELQIVKREEVDYIDVSPRQIFSLSASLIPFIENDDANRALMGANMQRQAVPLVETEAPFIMTGMEKIAAENSGYLVKARRSGYVKYVDANKIIITTDDGDEDIYELIKFTKSNAATTIHQVPIVDPGQRIEAGQAIASGPSMSGDTLALGRNVLVAFLPWEGYNFEDAVVISEELVRDNVYDSIHIDDFECKATKTKLGDEEITREIPGVPEEELRHLDEKGIVLPGTWVKPGNILVGKLTPEGESELSPEEKLLRAIFGDQAKKAKDTSLRVPPGLRGKVMDVYEIDPSSSDPFSEDSNLLKMVMVYIAQYRHLQVGDKMAGRHGNKGVISVVVPVEDMPFLADGTPIQMVLNPLGVPSRMNVGQIMETHLGLVCKLLGIRMEVPSFYKMTHEEIREWMKKALEKELMDLMGDNKRAYSSKELLLLMMRRSGYTIEHVLDLLGFDREKLMERLTQAGYDRSELEKYTDEGLKKLIVLDDLTEDEHKKAINKIIDNLLDGKFILYDGKTGQPFKQPVIVGYMYMMKLIHLAEDKIHARSTGPYSLVTQQPLGGKAQFGGQRFGEMEVWALEAYGASYALQEMLTIKSDDITGRYKAYEAIIKDENIKLVTIPESFKVLIKELQALGMNIEIITKDNKKIIPKDYGAFEPEEESLIPTYRI